MAERKVIGEGSLEVSVVTPRGALTQEKTDGVTAPGELGEFEILPGHIPFLTTLHSGVLVLGEKGAKAIYAVGPGFLRVDHAGKVDVLVEQAVAGSKVDTSAAASERDAAARELKGFKDKPQDAEWRNVKARHDWAQAQLDAHSRA
jgi:F-type H+-transporting ATPase subunit epsilon